MRKKTPIAYQKYREEPKRYQKNTHNRTPKKHQKQQKHQVGCPNHLKGMDEAERLRWVGRTTVKNIRAQSRQRTGTNRQKQRKTIEHHKDSKYQRKQIPKQASRKQESAKKKNREQVENQQQTGGSKNEKQMGRSKGKP